jgi:hypothetical protein
MPTPAHIAASSAKILRDAADDAPPMSVIDEAADLALQIEQALPEINGFLPLPNPVDGLCSRLVALYVAGTRDERAEIRSAGTLAQYRVMLTFCDRMAVLSVRSGSKELLFEALVAHAVEDFRWDPRENIMRLALVHHSANKLGVDSPALFGRAAEMASDTAAEYLRRPPLRIEACGYTEFGSNKDFEYRRDW